MICILLKAVKEGPGGMAEIENTQGLKFISIRLLKHPFYCLNISYEFLTWRQTEGWEQRIVTDMFFKSPDDKKE